jgi:hypothetical protein
MQSKDPIWDHDDTHSVSIVIVCENLIQRENNIVQHVTMIHIVKSLHDHDTASGSYMWQWHRWKFVSGDRHRALGPYTCSWLFSTWLLYIFSFYRRCLWHRWLKGVWHEIFDFRFFSWISPPGPQVFHWGRFEFFRKYAEIFANEYLSTPAINCSAVSTTPAKNLSPTSLTPAINPCHGKITKKPKIFSCYQRHRRTTVHRCQQHRR